MSTPPLYLDWKFQDGLSLQWDLASGLAKASRDGEPVWQGTLLPTLLAGNGTDPLQFIRFRGVRVQTESPTLHRLELEHTTATATLEIHTREDGLSLRNFELTWSGTPLRLHSLYLGATELPADRRSSSGYTDREFFPDWQAWGYFVPGARTAPAQSFFRCFDLGHCTIPLGSFGPAMGTPYAAAYPRPILSAALGNDHAWVCFGAGEVPDAAMSLKVEASNGCLEWRYREDRWGAPEGQTRRWEAPLEICLAATAYESYERYFRRFPTTQSSRPKENFDLWGTWGEFKEGKYDIAEFTQNAMKLIEPSVILIDDGWETFVSSGIPNIKRFPNLEADFEAIRQAGSELGLWQSLGWIDDMDAAGLGSEDVFVSGDGTPIQVDWAINPRTPGQRHFCPDISSPKAREYVRQRTRMTVSRLNPSMMKFDFTYGLPGPDQAVPRDHALRGERYAWHLLNLAAQAVNEENPATRVYSFTLHPLFHERVDYVCLDDLGDCGPHEAAGHAQWSLWASLLGPRAMPLNGSSGYYWSADAEVLLNSIILGAPGSCTRLDTGWEMRDIARRKACHRWHRRPAQWSPLWLNSHPGSLKWDIALNCWGRLEPRQGQDALTALALRDGCPLECEAFPQLNALRWKERWALIAQDDRSLFESTELACIPIDGGFLEIPAGTWSRVTTVTMQSENDQPASDFHTTEGTLRLEHTGDDSLLGFLLRA